MPFRVSVIKTYTSRHIYCTCGIRMLSAQLSVNNSSLLEYELLYSTPPAVSYSVYQLLMQDSVSVGELDQTSDARDVTSLVSFHFVESPNLGCMETRLEPKYHPFIPFPRLLHINVGAPSRINTLNRGKQRRTDHHLSFPFSMLPAWPSSCGPSPAKVVARSRACDVIIRTQNSETPRGR